VSGRLLSVNVGRAQPVERLGRLRRTGIRKAPVSGRVEVRGVNVAGDEQGDPTSHGGRDQAVYAYSREDYAWWEAELGRELSPGIFGETLTLEGLDVSGAKVGERWRVGTTLLEVTKPRLPCWKLEQRMELPGFIERFSAAARFGAYLRIVEEGAVAAGDAVSVTPAPTNAESVRDVGLAKLKREEGS
jgi:MOSC domain-containing protein YiiM